MANKPTQPVFPLGLAAEEQSTLAGVLNTGTIEHGPDAVLTLPEGNASAGLPSSVRYNADSDEFEGFYENGGWLPLGGGGIRWEVLPHASTATLTEGRGYLINNTTGASTVVLPSPTRIGDSVTICDAYGKFATYPLTVSPSGNNLYGSTEDMAITTDNVSATFTWSGPEQGWIITSGVGLGQGRVYSREIFTKILASETSTVNLNTPPTIVDVYADGKRLAESKYSLDGNVITFSPSLPASTELQVIEYTPIQLGNVGGSGSSTITWVYNGGSAIGGETEITLDVVVDDVPAIDINGSRQYKNLGFTFDPLTSKITLTQELEPEDEVVVIINGTPNIYNQIDHTLREVARAANVKDSEVILSTDTTQVLNSKKVLFDVVTQRIYGLPTLPTDVYINTVSNGQLTYSPGNNTVTLLDPYIRVAGGQTLQAAINMAKPFVRSGTFANGGEISTEYDTFYSHTDEHGNDYWWSYIGSSTFPVTVPANSTPDSNWMLVISDDFTAPLSPEIEIAGVSSLTSASVTYSVSDTSSFIVGKYAFISSTVRDGQWYCGIFKVLSKTSTTVELQQSNAKITASGTTLLGSCKIRAMNFIVNSPGGVTANGFVRRVEGVLFDGNGTASYGLMLGGGHNNTGVKRNSASIGSLRQCAFVNLRRSGATSDDVVGILVAAGSSLGVRNVAVNGTKIGIETYRNGSLIGMGAYVYDASNDAFKAEFTCNNYLYYCAAIKCGTGFSARYNAGGEYATIVCCNAVYGALAQFGGYCSVRNFNFYGMTSAGVYSTDGGYMLVAGTSEIDTCNKSYRCFQGATIEQIANTIITERNCAGGYNVNSASLRLLIRTVVSGGSDTWDGEGEVIINGVDQSLVVHTASTTIPANARAAWQVIFPFTFDESGARKVKFGIRYSDSALPAGVIVPFPAYYNSSSCRIYFYNLTAAPIALNATVYAYVMS